MPVGEVTMSTWDGRGRSGQEGQVREFASEHSYPEPPSALLALWRDPEFLAALGAPFGGVGEPQIEERGDRVLVRTKRAIPVGKGPGFVRRFLAKGVLEQVDDWARDPHPPIPGPGTGARALP